MSVTPPSPADPIESWEVLDLLTSLVQKSLVDYEEDEQGQGRYRFLEPMRQYARDRLLEAEEAEEVRRRHRDWFLALAEGAQPNFWGAEPEVWLDRVESEHDNLRAALRWTLETGQAETGLRLGARLWWFWHARGNLEEGREHLAGLLALPGAEARTTARAMALRGAGVLARIQGEYGEARALLEESLAIFRELGDKPGIALTLGHLGAVALAQGDHGAARALHEESLAISRELGDKKGIAWSLGALGDLGVSGQAVKDYRAARALLEESLTLFREIGDMRGIAWSLYYLGMTARDQGDYGAARALLEEGLAIFREIGEKPGIAWSLGDLGLLALGPGDYGAARGLLEESLAMHRGQGNKRGIASSLGDLGIVALGQGDHGTARGLWKESLAIYRELGYKQGMLTDLEALAAVAVAQAQSERAARLFGAAEGLRAAMNAPLPPAERAEQDRSVAAVRAALGEEAFAAAWAEGRVMSLEAAVEYALEEPDADPPLGFR